MENKQIVKYDVDAAAIAKMADIYLALTITDLEDQEQFDQVHSARMVMVKHRTRVDSRRVERNQEANAWIRDNNRFAKRLVDLMAPVEEHLKAEEKPVIEKEKREKAEKAEKLRVITQNRVDDLQEVGLVVSFDQASSYTGKDFIILLGQETIRFKAEKGRLAQEAADRKEEDARLEKIRKEQEDEAETLRLAQKKIDDEKAELKAEKQRVIDKEQKKEIDRLLAEEKVAKDKQDAIDKQVAEEKEKVRQEALRPDIEKLVTFGEELLAITGPELSDQQFYDFVLDALNTVHVVGRTATLFSKI